MKNIYFIIVCLLAPAVFYGQKLGPSTINNGGYSVTQGPQAYTFSIGEVMNTTISNDEITVKQGVIQNATGEAPIEADCAKNSAKVIFETCPGDNNIVYVFYEMEDGTLLDPYFDGISFANFDGQFINFDFVDADFDTPCSQADKAIIVTCIEEALPPADCTKNEGRIFFDACDDGEIFFFIETPQGDTLDPYIDEGIEIALRNDMKVNFDFVDADFDTPCSIAEKAVIVRCIEESVVSSNDEVLASQAINIYPNPAKDIIVVDIPEQQIEYIEIINTKGQIIQKKEVSSDQQEMNIANIPIGIYILKAKTDTGSYTQKLVINR